ncbi:MAG: hypothetical protein IT290_08950 [Deltaproteobacteria bacterium]|nr:hypothetical protein [Deltaproteobacteria bacterium]
MNIESSVVGEEELLHAAEAVVDAAAWCYFIRVGEVLPPKARDMLVRALLEDPSLSRSLFSYGGLDIQ